MKFKKFFVALVLACAMLFTGCANVTTAVDQQAVHENGGPFTNPKVVNCVEPGTRERQDWVGETFRYYPSGPRSWLFDSSSDSDDDAYKVYVKSPTIDGKQGQAISLTMPGEATMTLTGNCDLLMDFDEQYGRKYHAYVEESNTQPGAGWDTFLNAKFAPALQNGLNVATQGYTYDQIVADPNLRSTLQDAVAEATLSSLNRSLGDDYFTDVQVTLFQPTLPESIQTAIDQNEATKQFNAKVQTELDTMKELVKILGPNGYIMYKALQDGNIPVLPVPQGSGVSIPSN